MYGISAISSLSKSFSTKIRTIAISLKHVQRKSYQIKHQTSYNLGFSRVENDVVLFSLENPKFFIILNLFSASQCLVWTYLGIFFFRKIDKYNLDLKQDNILGKIFETERKYSKAISAVAVFFGWSIVFASCLYSCRSIRKIILHKGGKEITLFTYNIPGYNKVEVPLSHMSAREHRKKAKKYIPIKIKNRFFYYLIDVTGNFTNPNLFDFTVGVKRGI